MLPALRDGDLVLEGGRDEDVALDLEDLGVGDVGRAREALDGAVLLLPGDDLGDVEAARGVDAAGRVGDRDDRRALLGDQPRGDRAGVAEALDRDRRLGRGRCPRWRAASTTQKTVPRAVASLRPSEPPRLIGLPVTTPGTV